MGYIGKLSHGFSITRVNLDKLKKIIDNNKEYYDKLRENPSEWADKFRREFIYVDEEDIKIRAKKIVSLAYEKSYKRIIYLDGHGRLTAYLLFYLWKFKAIKKIGLTCVEEKKYCK